MSRDGDYETEQIGMRLTNHLAPLALNAIRELRREEALCDGYATRGESAGTRTSGVRDSTGAAILKAEDIRERLQRLFNLRNEVQRAVDAYAHFLKTRPEERIPAAADKPRCREGQHGRDASLWSDDLECKELATKLSLCGRHYTQYYRYRREHNIKTAHEFEPAG